MQLCKGVLFTELEAYTISIELEIVAQDYINDVSNSLNKEKEEFGLATLDFPVSRRPREFRRPLSTANNAIVNSWIQQYPDMISSLANTNKRKKIVGKLLYIQRDLFKELIREVPVTDLVEHCIPTYADTRPKASKPKLYT